MVATTYTALGQLLACVDHALTLSPSALSNCLAAPKTILMGQQLHRAMPVFARHPDLNTRVAEIMDAISLDALGDIPESVPLVDQGTMQLAYYQERSRLQPLGRPQGQSGVDWSTVDWSKTNAEIAESMGITRQAVNQARKRHAG